MKVRCKYSGVEFKSQGFGQFTVQSHHPLFDMSIPRLLSDILPHYLAGNLNEPESRVFFVTLLKKSELVIFDHPATPSLQTIHSNIQRLIATLSWTTASAVIANLPRYRIIAENSDLRNVKSWIREWNDAKVNWRIRQEDTQERTAFLIRQEFLEKIIKSPYKKMEQHTGRLARWMLEATNAPLALHKLWIEIFQLTDKNIFSFPLIDITELLEWMEEKLDATSSSVADIALKHIRRQHWKCSKGVLYGLDDFEDEEEVQLVLSRDQGTPYIMLSRHERMLRAAAVDAPSSLPLEKDYPTRVAYLRAKAKWGVAQQLQESQKQRESTIQIVSSVTSKEVEREQEEKALLDPSFDTDGEDASTDEAEGVYEDLILQTLHKLNELEAPSSSSTLSSSSSTKEEL